MKRERHHLSVLPRLRISLVVLTYFIPAGVLNLTAGSEADSSRPHASVCLAVREDISPKEAAFTPLVEPGSGKFIIAHAVASVPCILLVVALNQRDGQLAYGWRPQFAELDEPWEEVALPRRNPFWRWEIKAEPFDFYALFLSAGSPIAQEIKGLVAVMQDPAEEQTVLKLQTNKLRELISRAVGDSDPSKHQATASVTEVNGVTRGPNEFLWRSFASKVYFDDRKSGLLVFRSNLH